jgi:hypothetical protein
VFLRYVGRTAVKAVFRVCLGQRLHQPYSTAALFPGNIRNDEDVNIMDTNWSTSV